MGHFNDAFMYIDSHEISHCLPQMYNYDYILCSVLAVYSEAT